MLKQMADMPKNNTAQRATDNYHLLFNSIDQGFCIIEVLFNDVGEPYDYRFLEINPAFSLQTGIKDGVGKRIGELAPEHETFWFKTYGHIARTGESARFEHEAAALGKYYDVYAFRVGEAGENQVAILFNDIGGRKQVEEALRKSEEKFRNLFNSIDEGFVINELLYNEAGIAYDTLVLETNPSFDRMMQTSNAVGKRAKEIFPNAEDSWFEAYASVVETGESQRFENYLASLDRWFELHISRVGDAGSQRFAIVFNDITERKQREQQQEYLLEISDAGRSIADPIAIEETVTCAAMEYFEADRCYYCELVAGNAVIKHDAFRGNLPPVSGTYPLDSFALFKRVVDEGRPFVVNNAVTSDKLDEPLRALCIQLQVISFVDVPVMKNGEAVGMLCIVQSTPRNWAAHEVRLASETAERIWAAVERAKAEKALRSNQQQLQELLKIREDFIAVASHELKTPITSIKAYAEIVAINLREQGDSKNETLVEKLRKQINRLIKLITDLLDTTRIGEIGLTYQKERLELHELLADRANELQAMAGRRRIVLQLPGTAHVMADQERIGQLVVNLISNAIKYSPEGTNISITSKIKGNDIEVAVADQGIGIPQESLQLIFDRFYRVGGHPMNTYPGIGLGLFIATEIVRNHGGTIEVSSEVGEGSTFTFTLPLIS